MVLVMISLAFGFKFENTAGLGLSFGTVHHESPAFVGCVSRGEAMDVECIPAGISRLVSCFHPRIRGDNVNVKVMLA
jgi:hypothetical protein